MSGLVLVMIRSSFPEQQMWGFEALASACYNLSKNSSVNASVADVEHMIRQTELSVFSMGHLQFQSI